MRNTYKIIWSEEAYHGLSQILKYLEIEFSEKTVKKFVERFDRVIVTIQANPFTYPKSFKSNTIRRALVNKLTSIYYTVDGKFIRILSVFDNRMDPDRLRL